MAGVQWIHPNARRRRPEPLSRHVWRTLQLAAPIVVARAAVLVMTVGDT
jgi:hypothetical protein